MSFPVIFFSLIIGNFSWAASDCKFSPISAEELGKNSFVSVLTKWQAKTPTAELADLVCCLPESWRKNFLVVPESKSLQCSSSAFPRVLIFDPSAKNSKDPIRAVVSFVGKKSGDSPCNYKFSGENNSGALEIMEFDFRKKLNERLEFSHLKSHGESESNPFVCLDCHSTPIGMRPITGERQSYLWPEGKAPSGACVTPEEESQQKKWREDFEKLTLAEKLSPYKCLVGTGMPAENRDQEFFRRIALAQNYQVVPRIKSSPAFKKFKYSFLAAALQCSKIKGIEFGDFLLTGEPSASLPPENLDHRTCKDEKGICGNSIPVSCLGQNKKTSEAVQAALREQPRSYGSLLAEVIIDQGRVELNAQSAKYAQLLFLARKQPEHLGLEEALREYSDPSVIDFGHFAELLSEDDAELSDLFLESKKKLSLACGKLKKLSFQQRPRPTNLPSPEEKTSTNSAL